MSIPWISGDCISWPAARVGLEQEFKYPVARLLPLVPDPLGSADRPVAPQKRKVSSPTHSSNGHSPPDTSPSPVKKKKKPGAVNSSSKDQVGPLMQRILWKMCCVGHKCELCSLLWIHVCPLTQAVSPKVILHVAQPYCVSIAPNVWEVVLYRVEHFLPRSLRRKVIWVWMLECFLLESWKEPIGDNSTH